MHEPKFKYLTRAAIRHYKVRVRWKGYEMSEEYECTEKGIKLIVKEFKAMKDRPWDIKVFGGKLV